MDPCEATNVLLAKIKTLDPENASKIMGYILIQDLKDGDLVRLALGPETLLQSVIVKAKTHLGLSTNTLFTPSAPSSPSPPLNPMLETVANSFSQPSPRLLNEGSFVRNPSPHSWPDKNCSTVSPKSSPFLSYDNIRSGSSVFPPFLQNDGNVGTGGNNNNGDLLDEYQLDEYFSFLDDSSSKNEEFTEPGVPLGDYSGSNEDTHLHRRRFSESDVCFGAEDGGFGMGFRPCTYFARGFCKNGDACKFVHGGIGGSNIGELNGGGGGGPMFGSPREMEGLYIQQHEEMMRMKATQQQQQQRLAYNKYMNFLLQQQNDSRSRLGAAAAMMGDEFHKFGPFGPERNDFLAMGMAEKANSASRQIYLTFPADSTFKDEDVSNYFSTFGPVQDVRIPYQQKRMFGFVTFVHPETVKLILARGNPHFICDSRVLVKPYKEKGKIINNGRRQHLQQQLLERGNFSPGSSPSALSPRELYDLHVGARMLHNMQEIMLRRKLEEQAELQQAIELQGRRLINLQLPDLRGDFVRHHQRSLSFGAPFSSPTHTPVNQNVIFSSDGPNQEAIEDNCESTAAAVSFSTVPAEQNGNINGKEESSKSEGCDDNESNRRNIKLTLPDNIFVSPTKSSGNQHEAIATNLAAVTESTESESNAALPATSSSEASH